MGLETATYISGLNASNPVHATDQVGEGDDHIRLIKSTLLNTFPNVTGAMTASHTELNLLDGVASKTGTGALVLADAPTMTLNASMLTAGSIADARVPASNVTQHVASLNHDALLNFVANEHIDHSAVSITAGGGLTGGGTIAATRSLDVGAGTGITVNANDVAINQGFAPNWTGIHTFQNDVLFDEDLEVAGILKLSAFQTGPSWGSAQNNVVINDGVNVYRMSSSTSVNVSGFTGGVDGRIVHFANVGSNAITFLDESALSTAANRIRTTGAGLSITEQGGCTMWYDITSSRWRIMSNP